MSQKLYFGDVVHESCKFTVSIICAIWITYVILRLRIAVKKFYMFRTQKCVSIKAEVDDS